MARQPGPAVTDAPPSRYKVVERGRRLVVIDMATGQPAARETVVRAPVVAPADRGPIAAQAPADVDDRSGAAIFTTSRLYDLKGPRRIVMTAEASKQGSRRMGWWAIAAMGFVIATFAFPALLIVPVLIAFQPRLRLAARQHITARLDEMDQATR